MAVVYEWDVESVSAVDSEQYELGEVIDHHHTETFAEARAQAATPPEQGQRHEIVLVRDDDAGRSWAYLEPDEIMPDHFHDAEGRAVARVPMRFVAEIERARVAP